MYILGCGEGIEQNKNEASEANWEKLNTNKISKIEKLSQTKKNKVSV